MDISRGQIKTILQRSAPTLREQLDVDNAFTISLVAKEVLKDEERRIIDDIHIMQLRVDKLLDTMTRKPPTAYQSFVQVLLDDENTRDLYNAVKSIEQKVYQGACL